MTEHHDKLVEHAITVIKQTHAERWKHHGFGLIQVSVTPAHRLNIWAQELRSIGQDEGGWHTHRALVHATVLAGSVYNTDVEWGLFEPITTRPARKQDLGALVDAWKVPHRGRGGMRIVGTKMWADIGERKEFRSGSWYSIKRGRCHCTEPGSRVAVTSAMVMEMTDDEATVLVVHGNRPKPAFDHRCSDALIDELRGRALALLMGVGEEGSES